MFRKITPRTLSVGFRELWKADKTVKSPSKILRIERTRSIHSTTQSTPGYGPIGRESFVETTVIYRNRSNLELLRSFLVFQMCSFDFLVDRQAKLLKLTRTLLGKSMFEKLMEATIFGQFMVREEEEKILRQLRKQVESGIHPMLTYTAAEFHGASSSSPEKEMDAWLENNFKKVMRSLSIASKCYEFSSYEPAVTTKVTFLTRSEVLKLFNDIIDQQNNYLMTDPRCPELNNWLQERTRERNLSSLLQSACFHLDLNKFLLKTNLDAGGANLKILSKGDTDEIEALIHQMKTLSRVALELKITLAFDAEQTYLQSAIDALVLDVQRLFNRDKPVVLNTYQCYLKKTGHKVHDHLQLAKREKFCFGGKIVRGAYMIEERNLARAENRPEPLNENYEATSLMYKRVTESLLDEIKRNPGTPRRIIFATHNQQSVLDILHRLEHEGIDAVREGISFAQLIGMRDYITYTLGWKGIPVFKLVHYSNPIEGLAYLSRRLNENRSGFESVEMEKKLPLLELGKRLKSLFSGNSS